MQFIHSFFLSIQHIQDLFELGLDLSFFLAFDQKSFKNNLSFDGITQLFLCTP
jgi:hypothetical protein